MQAYYIVSFSPIGVIEVAEDWRAQVRSFLQFKFRHFPKLKLLNLK